MSESLSDQWNKITTSCKTTYIVLNYRSNFPNLTKYVLHEAPPDIFPQCDNSFIAQAHSRVKNGDMELAERQSHCYRLFLF